MSQQAPLLPEGLLEIMQCPVCGGELTERHDPPSLVCSACAKWYPVEDGVPVMLEEAARPLS
jgi:uncharacterized protein YbaR (Trm112 family)